MIDVTDAAPDPRTVLRDAIAAKIHAFDCTCGGEGEPRFSDERMAEKVMELFPDVGVAHEYRRPGFVLPVGEGTGHQAGAATHTRLVLCMEPVPVEPGLRTGGATP